MAVFPTPLEGGGIPGWAIAIIVSSITITLLWVAALVVLIVYEIKGRNYYRWVPSRASSPNSPTHTLSKHTPHPSRAPQHLSGLPPPPISPPLNRHSSSSSSSATPTSKEPSPKTQFPPPYDEPTSYALEVPNLDPFEEPEKEYHLQLRRNSSFSSMASSAASEAAADVRKKVPVAVSHSKKHSPEATPTSSASFTRVESPEPKHASRSNAPGSPLSGMILSRPVTVRQLGATIREPGYLESEFRKLPNPMVGVEDIPRGTERLNRYSNVLPTPKTRVHLTLKHNLPNSDYINANHIRGCQGAPRQYIATQGPMESTVEAFWRMVWEYGVDTIVMATNFQERGIDKCTRYWPAQGTEGYGSLEVSLVHQTVQESYSEATLSLRNMEGGEVRSVRHYRLTCWPTQGVPKDTKIITKFLREIKMADSQGPVVVHCSAGIGRTGVLLSIDIGLQGLLQGNPKIDVLRIVSTLRQDRAGSVQTREQYRFIHQALYDVARELGPQKGARP